MKKIPLKIKLLLSLFTIIISTISMLMLFSNKDSKEHFDLRDLYFIVDVEFLKTFFLSVLQPRCGMKFCKCEFTENH